MFTFSCTFWPQKTKGQAITEVPPIWHGQNGEARPRGNPFGCINSGERHVISTVICANIS